MTYGQALAQLNGIEKVEIAKAVFSGEQTAYAETEAGKIVYNHLKTLEESTQYDMIEEFQYEMSQRPVNTMF